MFWPLTLAVVAQLVIFCFFRVLHAQTWIVVQYMSGLMQLVAGLGLWLAGASSGRPGLGKGAATGLLLALLINLGLCSAAGWSE